MSAKKTIEQKLADNSAWVGDCREWTGAKTHNGYGVLSINGRRMRAHRVAYVLYFGEDPSGLDVCHKCDNRCCVNPQHLFAGTRTDNMQDAKAKGRMRVSASRIKLPDSLKDEVADLLTAKVSMRAISKKFGVALKSIQKFIDRHGLRNITV